MRPAADGATKRIAAKHRHEISDALLKLLTRFDLPAPAVAAAGWLLSHMLPGPCAAAAAVTSTGANGVKNGGMSSAAALDHWQVHVCLKAAMASKTNLDNVVLAESIHISGIVNSLYPCLCSLLLFSSGCSLFEAVCHHLVWWVGGKKRCSE